MKPVDKVVRRGDYYEMEVVEDGLFPAKPYKKEEAQSTLQSNTDFITTQLPNFQTARQHFNYSPKSTYLSADPDQLLHELEAILLEHKLTDQDQQEVLKLIREVQGIKEAPLRPLPALSPSSKTREVPLGPMGCLGLKVELDLVPIEERLGVLEEFPFPELTSYEQQLQILLGERKAPAHSQIPKDQRNKEDVQQLYSLLSGLKVAEDVGGVVDRIHANSAKFSQVWAWSQQMEATSEFHLDFLAELNEDELLLDQLEANFKNNLQTVRQKIAQLTKN